MDIALKSSEFFEKMKEEVYGLRRTFEQTYGNLQSSFKAKLAQKYGLTVEETIDFRVLRERILDAVPVDDYMSTQSDLIEFERVYDSFERFFPIYTMRSIAFEGVLDSQVDKYIADMKKAIAIMNQMSAVEVEQWGKVLDLFFSVMAEPVTES